MTMDSKTPERVAIAAAVAGKCQPCFDHHFNRAKKLGVGEDLLDEVAQSACNIRASGDKHMDDFAKRPTVAKEKRHEEDSDPRTGMP